MKIMLIGLIITFARLAMAEEFVLIEYNHRSIDQNCKEYPSYIVQTGAFESFEACNDAKLLSEHYITKKSSQYEGYIFLECKINSHKTQDEILSEMEDKYFGEDNPPMYKLAHPVLREIVDGESRVVGRCAQ